MIETRGLTKRYGPTLAVDDLSFTIRPGRVTGFLGPNGGRAGRLGLGEALTDARTALDHGGVEQAAGAGCRQVGADRPATGGLAADGHLPRVTTEGGDVALDPAQRRLLVEQAVVAGLPAAFRGQPGVCQEAERAEPVVDRHHDRSGAADDQAAVVLARAEHEKIELDRELWTEFGMGPAEIARVSVKPRLTLQSLTTWNGLLHAEAVDGTFWSTSDAYWRLARDAMNGLHPGTRLLSFVDTLTRPVLEQVPTRDLLAIRGNDDAFDAFRRHLALSEDLIGSDPDEERFAADVARVFDEVFRPNIRVIEKAMRRNTLLRDLPFVLATAGFAVAGGVASAAPPAATLFGALSSLLGFGPAVRDGLRREAKAHQEPAFVFWKLGVPGVS